MKLLLAGIAISFGLVLAGCESDATIAERNLTKAADQFEVNRRIVFYNGITDSYMLLIEGKCSMDLNSAGTAFNVICKTGPSSFKRHTQVLSDNTSAFVEQLEDVESSVYHTRIIFKPQTIIPDIELQTSLTE